MRISGAQAVGITEGNIGGGLTARRRRTPLACTADVARQAEATNGTAAGGNATESQPFRPTLSLTSGVGARSSYRASEATALASRGVPWFSQGVPDRALIVSVITA